MRKDTLATIVGTAVLALALAGPAAAKDPTLLASWSFDAPGQTAIDATGNGNDGRLGSTPGPDAQDPIFVDGRLGNGLAFDGNAFVQVPDTARLEPQRITVAAWVRRLGSPGKFRYVLSKGAVECDRSAYGLYSASNGGLGFYISTSSAYFVSPLAVPATVWNGQWHYVTGTYDGTRVRLYVDGTEIGDGTAAPPAIAYGIGSKGVFIGSYHGTCDLPFAGDIDEVRIWDTARDAASVAVDAAALTLGAPSSGSNGVQRTESLHEAGSGQPRACYAVRLNHTSLTLKHRAKLVATVRDRGRLKVGVRLTVRGAGVRASLVSRRLGRAVLYVRPKWRTKVTVRVVGQRSSCPSPTIRVKRPRH